MKTTILLVLLLNGFSYAGVKPFKTVGPDKADSVTVQAAIDAVPAGNRSRKVILIQPGAYFGNRVAFRRCRIMGWQDTINVPHSGS